MHRLTAAALAAAILATPVGVFAADKPQTEEADEGGATLVRATTGHTYFNRAGATLDAHNAELTDCIGKAGKIVTMDQQVNGAGLFADWSRPGPIAAAVENCMVVRGWRVVRLPEIEGELLEKMPAPELSATLAEWIGQAEPHGEIARVWSNEAARASVRRYAVRQFFGGKSSLSTRSLGKVTIPDNTPPAGLVGLVADARKIKLDKSWPVKPLKPAAIAQAPAKTAVVIIGVKGISLRNGVAVSFQRVGADGDPMPALKDLAPDFTTAAGRWGKKEGYYTVMALPPGKWRVATLGIMPTLGFCFGSPAFEARAGEVIYAGMFDLGSETLGPDLALEPVKALLSGQPAADQVRAASYVNGSTASCMGAGLYALEIPGAPFEEGYTGGGARRVMAAPVTDAAPAAAVEAVATPAIEAAPTSAVEGAAAAS